MRFPIKWELRITQKNSVLLKNEWGNKDAPNVPTLSVCHPQKLDEQATCGLLANLTIWEPMWLLCSSNLDSALYLLIMENIDLGHALDIVPRNKEQPEYTLTMGPKIVRFASKKAASGLRT